MQSFIFVNLGREFRFVKLEPLGVRGHNEQFKPYGDHANISSYAPAGLPRRRRKAYQAHRFTVGLGKNQWEQPLEVFNTQPVKELPKPFSTDHNRVRQR